MKLNRHPLALWKWLEHICAAALLPLLPGHVMAAESGDLIHAPLNLDRVGVVYEEIVHIPESAGFHFYRRNQVDVDLKVTLTEKRPDQLTAQLRQARDQARPSHTNWASVDLYRVSGVLNERARRITVKNSRQLFEHSFPFKLVGVPIRLRVMVIPQEPNKTVTHTPGQWAYVRAYPKDLLERTGPFAAEEINLAECLPENEGPFSRNKYLLQLKALDAGSSYRVQISNLDPITLPAGISVTLRLAQPTLTRSANQEPHP